MQFLDLTPKVDQSLILVLSLVGTQLSEVVLPYLRLLVFLEVMLDMRFNMCQSIHRKSLQLFLQFVNVLLCLNWVWQFHEVVIVDGLRFEICHLVLPLGHYFWRRRDNVYLFRVDHPDYFVQSLPVFVAQPIPVFLQNQILVLDHFQQSKKDWMVCQLGF